MIRRIDDSISVAPQITPEDVAEIAAAGFTAIVNNRPDDEEGGQPEGDAIRAAAEAAGGPVLAYCRSGTRSCNLWALARAKQGDHPDRLMAKAAATGYDLTGIRPLLDALAGGR